MITKVDLRTRITAARNALRPPEVASRSRQIVERLLGIPEVQAARSVFTYVSTGREASTHDLIRALIDRDKIVCVPRIRSDGTMEACRIRDLIDLSPGPFGIPAPTFCDPLGGTPDVTICPGVAFSLRGDRLGRGKAYYDRYLAAHPGTFTIGLCYEIQLVRNVPTTPEDVQMSLLVTERRAIRRSPR